MHDRPGCVGLQVLSVPVTLGGPGFRHYRLEHLDVVRGRGKRVDQRLPDGFGVRRVDPPGRTRGTWAALGGDASAQQRGGAMKRRRFLTGAAALPIVLSGCRTNCKRANALSERRVRIGPWWVTISARMFPPWSRMCGFRARASSWLPTCTDPPRRRAMRRASSWATASRGPGRTGCPNTPRHSAMRAA